MGRLRRLLVVPRVHESQRPRHRRRCASIRSTLGFDGLKRDKNAALANKLRLAMLIAGVDIMGAPGGVVSATHGDREIEQTVEAFRQAVRMIKAEGELRG